MSTVVKTYNLKQKIWNSYRRHLLVPFIETIRGISSDTLVNVDIESNNSVITAATMRIGQVTVERKSTVYREIIEDGTIGSKRIGRVTLLNDASDVHDIKDFKQGYNVKRLDDTTCSMLPHLTINAPDIIDEFGNVINTYEETTFGQLYSYYFNVISDGINRKNIPFFDFPGRLDPVTYITRGEYYRAYMIVNNLIEDYLHFIEPDSIIHDGAIDVFEVRSKKANTGIADIQTKGIRASFASGPWDLPAGSHSELRRGTSPVTDHLDVEPYQTDFFEDCQDLVFGDSIFTKRKGGESGSGFKYSLDGYVSEGHYLYPPYVDKTARDRAYEKRYIHSGNNTLKSAITNNESVRDISVIGTRFKSATNGSILRPRYDNVAQSILGTDSIAFAGRKRE